MKYSLRNPIVATLAYYDIFDYPLTLLELDKYLINPARFTKLNGKYSIEDLSDELRSLVSGGIIYEKNGFYSLPIRPEIWEIRIDREKIAAQKWKKFLKISKYLMWIPYLRSMSTSGSLAIENTVPQSDFDVFLITKSNRLYLCRLILWITSSILRSRRGRFEKTAPDKLCFNHYVSESGLTIEYRSLYAAQVYVSLRPVIDRDNLLSNFYEHNKWMTNYISHVDNNEYGRTLKEGKMSNIIRRFLEFVLNNRAGDILEKLAMRHQQNRIADNPNTYEPGGRVVFNDRVLEFHPRSFEGIVIDRYNTALKRLGIIPISIEKDSGLRK